MFLFGLGKGLNGLGDPFHAGKDRAAGLSVTVPIWGRDERPARPRSSVLGATGPTGLRAPGV